MNVGEKCSKKTIQRQFYILKRTIIFKNKFDVCDIADHFCTDEMRVGVVAVVAVVAVAVVVDSSVSRLASVAMVEGGHRSFAQRNPTVVVWLLLVLLLLLLLLLSSLLSLLSSAVAGLQSTAFSRRGPLW